MPACPHCQSRLRTVRQKTGIHYFCEQCRGRAVTIPQIRRVGGDRLATGLLREMRHSPIRSRLGCPFCTRPMQVLASRGPDLELDGCRPCNVVWFDPLEFEAVPEEFSLSAAQLEARATETIALHQLNRVRLQQERDDTSPPDETWKWLPGAFGMPVEMTGMEVSRPPWLIWGVAVAILIVSLTAFTNLDTALETWGMIPADWWRYGGLTFISSFLLHGGPWHLIGNLYFLLVFGDNVEEYLGRWRTAALLLAATAAGDVLHILFEHGSTTPAVGASGGISGIIVFYALQFPRARLGILFWYYAYVRWIRFPAWAALLFWVIFQGVGVLMQLAGLSNVSALAHLGGAGAGLVAWMLCRRAEAQ